MLKRSHFIALGLVTVLTLIVLNLPSRTSARLKSAISGFFLPLFGLAGATQKISGQAGDAIVPKSVLLRENNALQEENEQLRVQLNQSAETAREDARLRQLLGWQQKVPWKLKLANVITRDPANWWRTIEVDLGSRDGLRENLPVLSPDGYLIGRTSSVSLTRSQITLLGDPNCKASGLVEDEARDMGVIAAGGPFDGSFITMSYLASSANVQSGQNVVTSGLGGVFPKGITIGKIVDARQVEFGLYTEARVKLAANLSSLEEVWVMFP
ncbi:MAG TPA: rod shape-determining protein MreC [Verrucomicrobiae bacterium]|jgi:rod shape-determining protein MreC|nr:rod shape-determining protein MreC [Verrucomicrobiae bacterium]